MGGPTEAVGPPSSLPFFYWQLPPSTSRIDVTRIWSIALSLRDAPAAAPGWLGGLASAAELELPALFCNVPFTSTFFPTSDEKFEALPLNLYEVPDIDELAAPGVLAVGLPAAEPAVPVGALDEDPLPIVASARM